MCGRAMAGSSSLREDGRGMNESKRFTDRIEEAIREAEARYIVDGNRVKPGPGALPAAGTSKPEMTDRPDEAPVGQNRAPAEAMGGC
jgi:hypothetical protein